MPELHQNDAGAGLANFRTLCTLPRVHNECQLLQDSQILHAIH